MLPFTLHVSHFAYYTEIIPGVPKPNSRSNIGFLLSFLNFLPMKKLPKTSRFYQDCLENSLPFSHIHSSFGDILAYNLIIWSYEFLKREQI